MSANRLCRFISFLTVVSSMLTAQVRRIPDTVLLKHWPSPLYWQPQTAQATTVDPPANPLVLVAMTPCRIVDTRASQDFPSPFGAPSLSAGVSRTFRLQSSTRCSIPFNAQAYSVNITVVPQGPVGFLTAYPTGQPLPLAATLVWSQGSTSNGTSNAAVVPGGTSGSIDLYANNATDVVIDINGYYTLLGVLDSVNTGLGISALVSNTTGANNTAIGAGALFSNTTGMNNTAIGNEALLISTGTNNIGIGASAGAALSSGSDNILIGNGGLSGDSGTIRVGQSGNQTSFFAAGVRGVTTGANNAIPVVIDSSGQLGTVSSSRRFKEDIQDMGEASSGLLQLRPVSFRYKQPFADGSKPIQYGLIAEEVAEVFPDLVVHSADGQIETVKYQILDVLLLNELRRQEAEIRALKERLDKLESQAK
jgi:hypothetical protein